MKSKHFRRKQKPQGQEKQPFFSKRQKTNDGDNSAFFQPKLKIGGVTDPMEKEADAVANQIVDQPKRSLKGSNEVQRKDLISRQKGEEEEAQTKLELQRQGEEEEEAQTKLEVQREAEEEEMQTKLELQRQGEEEEEAQTKLEVQREAEEEEMQPKKENQTITPKQGEPNKKSGAAAPPQDFEARLKQTKGKGFQLPDDIRTEMEQQFGADFSSVRIHTDSEAISLSKAIRAQAFTHGYDLYFNQGKYSPNTKEGKRLLAHELTHVVQQKGKNK